MSHGHSSHHDSHGPDNLHQPDLLIDEHPPEPPPTPAVYKLLAVIAFTTTVLMGIIAGLMVRQRDAALAELDLMKKGGYCPGVPAADAPAPPDWLKNSSAPNKPSAPGGKPPVEIVDDTASPPTANSATQPATPASPPGAQPAPSNLPEYPVKSGDSMVKIGQSLTPKYCGLSSDEFNKQVVAANPTANTDFQAVTDVTRIIAGKKIHLPAVCTAAPTSAAPAP